MALLVAAISASLGAGLTELVLDRPIDCTFLTTDETMDFALAVDLALPVVAFDLNDFSLELLPLLARL